MTASTPQQLNRRLSREIQSLSSLVSTPDAPASQVADAWAAVVGTFEELRTKLGARAGFDLPPPEGRRGQKEGSTHPTTAEFVALDVRYVVARLQSRSGVGKLAVDAVTESFLTAGWDPPTSVGFSIVTSTWTCENIVPPRVVTGDPGDISALAAHSDRPIRVLPWLEARILDADTHESEGRFHAVCARRSA